MRQLMCKLARQYRSPELMDLYLISWNGTPEATEVLLVKKCSGS